MPANYYAITAYEHTEIPNKYKQPLTAMGTPNTHAGQDTVKVWRWLVIAQGATFQQALENGQKTILKKAGVINPNQLVPPSPAFTMYQNLKVVRQGELGKYRITILDGV